MKPKFQSRQEAIINAPLEKVWEFNQDLSKIAAYHPRVDKVDLVSGKQFREEGVAYQCHIAGSKHTCIEKDIEIVPMVKIVTVFPSDTMGLTKLLPDYMVESNLSKIDVLLKEELLNTNFKSGLVTLNQRRERQRSLTRKNERD